MLVTERVEARMHVDHAQLRHEGAVQTIASELARAVAAEADQRAYKVRPESVHVRYAGESDDFRALYIGVWSPRTARFVGGEYDGDTIRVERDNTTGIPPNRIVRPYRESWSWESDLDVATPASMPRNPEYERSGIHPVDDVWVYTHIA